jgi:hypothetical protein
MRGNLQHVVQAVSTMRVWLSLRWCYNLHLCQGKLSERRIVSGYRG